MTTRRTFVSFLSALGTYAAFPDCQAAATAPKIKVGQIGTKHAHASGKVGTARKFPELYDVVGIVEPDDAQWNRVKKHCSVQGSAPYDT